MTKWEIHGQGLSVYNCNYGCPCLLISTQK